MRHRLVVVAAVVLLACGLGSCAPGSGALPTGSGPSATNVSIELRGRATAGPICPVVTQPPDPACADRPVAGAVLLIVDGRGHELARLTSAADGTFAVRLPPGDYRLLPQPVDGLLGTAPEQRVRLTLGGNAPPLEVSYDTGIR